MSTFADINKAKEGKLVTFVDDAVPAGHFGATTKILGLTTVYLLEGQKDAADAVIKGRVELVPHPEGTAPGSLRVYTGGNLKGGTFAGTSWGGKHGFAETFQKMVQQ